MIAWEQVLLGDVLTLHYGKALDQTLRVDSGTVPVYGANGIKDYAEVSLAVGPSLVVGRKGSAGEVTRVEGPFWPLDVTYYTEHDESKIEFDFLEYMLLVLGLPSLAKGVKPGINRNDVYALQITLPPLDEQKRIVVVLDQAFAALDHARVNVEANLANVESLFDSTLRASLSVHVDWPIKTLPEISENLDRQRIPVTKKDRKPGPVPYYGASGVVDHVADHLFDEDLLLVSEDGANLLARTYPIAFSISGKSWVNNHAHVLRFDDPMDQEYVRFYLNSISLEPYVSGMAQPKLNQSSLNEIPIPFPDEHTRAAIVSKASNMRQQCETLVQSYSEQLADITALRQSLLQAAFSGQLT